MIDLASLFEPEPDIAPFADLASQLAAVRNRTKGMSWFTVTKEVVDGVTAPYDEILTISRQLGLTIVVDPSDGDLHGRGPEMNLFVLHPDQAWRVPAFRAVLRTLSEPHIEWSDGLEYLTNYLLGYSDEQRAAWMSHIRTKRLGWRGRTFFAIVTDFELQRLAFSGMRSFEQGASFEEIVPFFHRGKMVLKSNSATLIPDGAHICRIAVQREMFVEIFGDPDSWGEKQLITGRIECDAKSLNWSLEAKIELVVQEDPDRE